MLVFGEVRTGLLQHSVPLPPSRSAHVLGLVCGERPRQSERPIAYAVSPDILTGIDCDLPTGSGAGVAGIGTVVSRASLTGGHVLQGSSFVRVVTGGRGDRRPWPYYLERPGIIEAAGNSDWDDVVAGLELRVPARSTLDLGAICEHVMGEAHSSAELDLKPPVPLPRTRLRWVVGTGSGHPPVQLRIENATLRIVRLAAEPDDVATIVGFCEDLALHDWLLTAVEDLINRSRIGSLPRADVMSRLSPAIDYLIHLWMPAARVTGPLAALWEVLERQPGFTRQWAAAVNRIRDQLTVGAALRPVLPTPVTKM